MSLVQKFHEQFDGPLSPDRWYSDVSSSGITVSGGAARINTASNNILRPLWTKPSGTPLALVGKDGVVGGELELQIKLTPRFRRTATDQIAQLNVMIWSTALSIGGNASGFVQLWSRLGTGISTTYGIRFRVFTENQSFQVGSDVTDIAVDSNIWLRAYINKASGELRFHTSTDGTTWTQRYSGTQPVFVSDGDGTVYIEPQLPSSLSAHFDVDDFILRTSQDELSVGSSLIETESAPITAIENYTLDIGGGTVVSVKSSSPAIVEGPPKVPVVAYGFGGGYGSAISFADMYYGSISKPILSDSELVVFDAFSEALSDMLALTQLHNINVLNSRSQTAYENIPIIHELTLFLNNANSDTYFDSFRLTEDYNLLTDSIRSESYIDGIILSQIHNLSLNSSKSFTYSDILNIYQYLLLNKPDDSISLTFSETAAILQQAFLLVDDTISRTKSNKIGIIDWARLSVEHGIYKRTTTSGTGMFEETGLQSGIYKPTGLSNNNIFGYSTVESGIIKRSSIDKEREL